MLQRTLITAVLAGSLYVAASFGLPATGGAQEQPPTAPPVQDEWLLYGSPLMSLRERAEFRVRLRDARTAEQQEAVRREYYDQMLERASQQGITLPGGTSARTAPGTSGQTAPGATTSETPPTNETIPGTSVSSGPVTEEGRTDGPVPGGPVPGGSVPGGSVPSGSVPGGPVPGGLVPGRPATEGTPPGDTSSGGMTQGATTVPGGGIIAPEGNRPGTGGAGL